MFPVCRFAKKRSTNYISTVEFVHAGRSVDTGPSVHIGTAKFFLLLWDLWTCIVNPAFEEIKFRKPIRKFLDESKRTQSVPIVKESILEANSPAARQDFHEADDANEHDDDDMDCANDDDDSLSEENVGDNDGAEYIMPNEVQF